jgi:hypothetical protein
VDWIVVGPDLAAVITLRLILLAGAFTLFFATTTPGEFRLALEWARVPYRYAFSVTVAFQTIGLLDDEWRTILEAQRARGVWTPQTGWRELLAHLGDLVALSVPAVVMTTKRAWAMTEAAYAPGFSSPHRKPYQQLAMDRLDWALLAGAAAVTAALLIWKQEPKLRTCGGRPMQRNRILIAVIVLILIVGAILGMDALQRALTKSDTAAGSEPTLVPGAIPIRLDGRLIGSFSPDNLEQLEKVSFVDAEEGKTQEGWLLRDVILLHVVSDKLEPDSSITVTSSSRAKSRQLTWTEVDDPANSVMFDLSSRGTLKLVSVLEGFDTRDEWVQDVDSIDIATP